VNFCTQARTAVSVRFGAPDPSPALWGQGQPVYPEAPGPLAERCSDFRSHRSTCSPARHTMVYGHRAGQTHPHLRYREKSSEFGVQSADPRASFGQGKGEGAFPCLRGCHGEDGARFLMWWESKSWDRRGLGRI